VRDEKTNILGFLINQANARFKSSEDKLREIKKKIINPPSTLPTYVEFVKELGICNAVFREISLNGKKKLEEMKSAYAKYKGKDEGSTTTSANNITKLTSNIDLIG